jgi:hypothetical protein
VAHAEIVTDATQRLLGTEPLPRLHEVGDLAADSTQCQWAAAA